MGEKEGNFKYLFLNSNILYWNYTSVFTFNSYNNIKSNRVGKTTTSSSLATLLSQNGRNVIL